MSTIELSNRQKKILQIVKTSGPITGEGIAEKLCLTRATLRPDLAILTMTGFLDARPRVGYFYTGKTSNHLLAEKLKKMQIDGFVSTPVVINENMSVYDAIVTVFSEDVGTLFVTDANTNLVGVLSRKDLLRASIGQQKLTTLPVNIIMTRMPNITMCQKDDLLIDVAKKLISSQIDAIPVVNKTASGYEVIGRFTKTNITRVLVELAEKDV
ncbi:helix-turn-helix transcriptional regulator [Lederbergia panacisoli]|uniref:helix-turn-helix transcriptional regulator n=1 Tax=Lederbergia panacisoli TaxID=1255251 RepID=UPI00214BA3D1|nr:helix-turn-helix transcriptional regulator [Lederbergia panacisoli]MCR2820425.1 helix-turn-helix transcriptional regulator [Lederbergia panacisoli]